MRETVLVTGASGGIGEAFAKVFAARDYDLILTARSADKLAKVAAALGNRVRVEVLPVDLSDPAGPEKLLSAIEAKAIPVDILVNNAGVGTFGPFAESSLEKELAQIRLNVVALTHLTQVLVAGMVKRGRGKILNVASTAAFQPGPWMSVYYATKAYVLSFSEALTIELKGSGVTVTCVCPGPTKSDFAVRANMVDAATAEKGHFIMMDAEVVARKGVDALLKGRRLLIPGLLNRTLAHATRLGSRGLNARIVRRLMKSIDSLREPR
jgi:short-subunit dehydrogenase